MVFLRWSFYSRHVNHARGFRGSSEDIFSPNLMDSTALSKARENEKVEGYQTEKSYEVSTHISSKCQTPTQFCRCIAHTTGISCIPDLYSTLDKNSLIHYFWSFIVIDLVRCIFCLSRHSANRQRCASMGE